MRATGKRTYRRYCPNQPRGKTRERSTWMRAKQDQVRANPPVYPTCCNSSWSRIRQWQTGGSWNGGSSKWMVYKGNSNKMADLGVPPFPETSMHHIHMIHYDTHLLDMIATWSCCRPKIRMAWWGFWVPATSPGGGRWDTQHGSATCTFFATHSLAYLNCNDIRRSEDVSKLGVALN